MLQFVTVLCFAYLPLVCLAPVPKYLETSLDYFNAPDEPHAGLQVSKDDSQHAHSPSLIDSSSETFVGQFDEAILSSVPWLTDIEDASFQPSLTFTPYLAANQGENPIERAEIAEWEQAWNDYLARIELQKAYEGIEVPTPEVHVYKAMDQKKKKKKHINKWKFWDARYYDAIKNIKIKANIMKPSRYLGWGTAEIKPALFNVEINPRILSDRSMLGGFTTEINPRFLSERIRPELISPKTRTGLMHMYIHPQMLYQQIQPDILSPDVYLNLLLLEAKPKLLTQVLAPCLLGPDVRVQLLKMDFSPALLAHTWRPRLLCPPVNLSMLDIKGSPKLLTLSDEPSVLSDPVNVALLKVDLAKKKKE